MTHVLGANLNNGAAVGPQGEGRDSPSANAGRHLKLAYQAWLSTLTSNTPAMPLSEAHFGGFFVSAHCRQMDYATIDPHCQLLGKDSGNEWRAYSARFFGYTAPNNTRQGYARKSTLKPAGYLFLGV